jgi:hypothetical protein
MVAALAAGPGDGRTLLMGTNGGLFASQDRGATWQQVTGGGQLPATDFTAIGFAPRHPERFYVASDGGGSAAGGLWSTSDGGGHFAALDPPQPSVTALAVAGDTRPELFVATLRTSDQAATIWTYRDAGGQPQGPSASPAPAGPGAAAAAPVRARPVAWLTVLLTGPEAPYLVTGACALLVVVVALTAHAARGRHL